MKLKELFDNNRRWAALMTQRDPEIFSRLSEQQAPKYLWIGCSDSRVPANEIAGLMPGELFVHRNVANVVVHTDLNCLSVIQYAVDVLKVRHIIVCGHYGCGGVQAAVRNDRIGLIENWLRHVQDVRQKHDRQLTELNNKAGLVDRMCELNVIEQALSVCQTTIVQDAWARNQPITVYGWIYSIADGLLRDLGMCVSGPRELAACYDSAVDDIGRASVAGDSAAG